jgi:Family of unknown function (DUF5754)
MKKKRFFPQKKNTKMLSTFSDPKFVMRKAARRGMRVEPSIRPDKKYMLVNGTKRVHFGAMGYEDWTKHRDSKRRAAFRTRNRKWAFAPTNSPAFLAYHLLW